MLNKDTVQVLLVTTVSLLVLGIILDKCTRLPFGGSVGCPN